MISPTPLTFLSLLLSTLVGAGTVGRDGPCTTDNNRLSVGTYQFWSECTSTNWCTPEGTCQPKGCRRDDFPFGYPQDSDDIPDKCPRGEFCPDEMDRCQTLLPVDSPCQLNRDDECEAPPNFSELADRSNRGLNVNGSVCLNNVCMWANATLGTACTVENTAFIGYGSNGEFIDIVSRGNCRIGLYCDSQQRVCMNNKQLGEACTADKECDSWNCVASGVCGEDVSIPRQVQAWVYVVVGLAILGGVFGTLFGLFLLHRKIRDQERERRIQYWREQNAFHQNLQQMKESARASIFSMPMGQSARSTMYSRDGQSDDSHTPILQTGAPRGSGLRYTMEDDSSLNDEGVVMQNPHHRSDGRF